MDKNKIKITRLMLIKADWDRTFMGTVKNGEIDDILHGTVVVDEGKMYTNGNTKDEIGKKLDELCTLKLDYNLHENSGINVIMCGIRFNVN